MRHVCMVVVAALVTACADSPPTAARVDALAFAAVPSELAPPTVFATQLRSDLEVPACTSASKGHAEIMIRADGTIDAQAFLNNKDGESVRFGHIHHLNPGAATGPIIWWLTSPIGTDLNLTAGQLHFAQAGAFVSNAHFADAATALAELRAHPQDFYVNFHSDRCPGGLARGFLP